MKRRTVLAGVAGSTTTALTGCLGNTTGDSPNGSKEMAFSLASIDDDPDPLAFEIGVVDETLSDDSVPTFDVPVENVGEETAEWTGTGDEFAFPQRYVTDELVIGLEEEVTARLIDEDGCARTEWGIDRDDVEVETTLEPAESMEQRYAVAGVDEEMDEPCPEPGAYRAEYEYGDHGTWGFEFELE